MDKNPFFYSSHLVLIFILSCLVEIRAEQASMCKVINGTYNCNKIKKSLTRSLDIPPNACIIHNCHSCVKTYKTFILSNNNQLIEPTNFILTAENETTYNIYHMNEEEKILNPIQINLEICLYDKKKSTSNSLHFRRLLEYENAKFSTGNLTFVFNDPILTFSGPGKAIVRTTEFEHIYIIPEDLSIILPFEILTFRTILSVIFIHNTGQSISGDIHISGKSFCQTRRCLLCPEIFAHLKCISVGVRYAIYTCITLILCLFLWCAKSMIKTLFFFLQLIFMLIYSLFKLIKLLARFSLLFGAYLGTISRNLFISIHIFLENQGQNIQNFPLRHVIVALLFVLFNPIRGECNTNEIIKSELKSCIINNEGFKSCELISTAEVTLPTLKSEVCLYFSDADNSHLFSLKIRLEKVTCTYSTKTLYYTFPVKAKHISQTTCSYNAYCGGGVHCVQPQIGKQGIKFEAETKESRDLPGISACEAAILGHGCLLVHRASCNFYRSYYEPDLINSYEVSQINNQICKYHIGVEQLENNTISYVEIKDSAYTDSGIKVSILGAYDQPQVFLSEAFVQRVANKREAYLIHACDQNNPKIGMVGSVQANQSYTKDFIFDPHLSTCDFFEDRLRCSEVSDPILQLQNSQRNALPIERDMHLFQINGQKLTSTLLVSAAVRVQLSFQNYKITTKINNVCPKFQNDAMEIAGCYKCSILAHLTFTALSTCQSGLVKVEFQKLNIYTKALHLTTSPQKLIIKFIGEEKCITDKLCLKSNNIIQCKKIEICLNEPSLELSSLLYNHTSQTSTSTSSNLWDWFKLPSFPSSLLLMKLIGSTLFIVCLSITIISTICTCFCRR